MSFRKIVIRGILPLLAAGALLALAGCGGSAETAASAAKDVRATLGQAARVSVPRTVTATGSLQAGTSIMISTRMMGWVRAIHVAEGQTVAAGDLLLTIDDGDLKAKQGQAEAGLAEANAVLANAGKMAARFEALYADKSVSKQQLDDVLTGRDRAAAGVRMAEAAVAEVKVHMGYLRITSPVDGIVARKNIEEGNMANPGMPLLQVETVDAMKVVAHLGEKDIASVAVGTPVEIDVTSVEGGRFSAPISSVVRTANPGSRTYDIEIVLPAADARLRSGMFARVAVPVGEREAVTVPAAAVHRRGQLTGVWTVDAESRAHLRWVRLGRDLGDGIEVLSGMDGTETVVLAADANMAEGDRVVN